MDNRNYRFNGAWRIHSGADGGGTELYTYILQAHLIDKCCRFHNIIPLGRFGATVYNILLLFYDYNIIVVGIQWHLVPRGKYAKRVKIKKPPSREPFASAGCSDNNNNNIICF